MLKYGYGYGYELGDGLIKCDIYFYSVLALEYVPYLTRYLFRLPGSSSYQSILGPHYCSFHVHATVMPAHLRAMINDPQTRVCQL